MKNKIKIFSLLGIFIVLLSILAQFQDTSAQGLIPYAISGYVTNGGPLQSVPVTITNLDTGANIKVFTNDEGFYLGVISDWFRGHTLEVIACNEQVNP